MARISLSLCFFLLIHTQVSPDLLKRLNTDGSILIHDIKKKDYRAVKRHPSLGPSFPFDVFLLEERILPYFLHELESYGPDELKPSANFEEEYELIKLKNYLERYRLRDYVFRIGEDIETYIQYSHKVDVRKVVKYSEKLTIIYDTTFHFTLGTEKHKLFIPLLYIFPYPIIVFGSEIRID